MATAYKRTLLTGGTTTALDAIDGNDLVDGDFAFCLVSGSLYVYILDASSALPENSPSIIAPDSNAGNKRWVLQRQPTDNSVPVGTIVPFVGGYFANGANGGFVSVLGNTVAAVNAQVNADGWYVCDGSAVNLSGSSIFNGASRYLPNLTDDRFLMGDSSVGPTGGDNSMSHTHTVDIASFTCDSTTLTIAQMPAHTHKLNTSDDDGSGTYTGFPHTEADVGLNVESYTTTTTGSSEGHSHAVNPPNTTSSGASNIENRPKYLSCFYIMKVQ